MRLPLVLPALAALALGLAAPAAAQATPVSELPPGLACLVLRGDVAAARTEAEAAGATPPPGWFRALFDALLHRFDDPAAALALASWWFDVDPETGEAAAAVDAARRAAR